MFISGPGSTHDFIKVGGALPEIRSLALAALSLAGLGGLVPKAFYRYGVDMAHAPNLEDLLGVVVGLREYAASLGADGERLAKRLDVEIGRVELSPEERADVNRRGGTWRDMIWSGVER
ncbi:hypothetical protein [Micromonospora ureilytica]|uniref:hypothetical protein n=1 Tax=Micromonospora ureilytica TaxID=709868 RepID=UPI00403A45A9